MSPVAARSGDIMPGIPLRPRSPERVCWGCDKYCPADDLACGNGTIRTPHPCELFGDDWFEWSESRTKDEGVLLPPSDEQIPMTRRLRP
jgi:hypothetical protein